MTTKTRHGADLRGDHRVAGARRRVRVAGRVAAAPRRCEPRDARAVRRRRDRSGARDVAKLTRRSRTLSSRGGRAASTCGRPQFLLDNMLHDGAAGYHVLTALRIAGRARARARESRLGARRRRSTRAARGRGRRRIARRSREGSSDCRGPACVSAPAPRAPSAVTTSS